MYAKRRHKHDSCTTFGAVLPIEVLAPDSFGHLHRIGPALAWTYPLRALTPPRPTTWMSILKPDQLPTLRQLYENQTLVHAPDVEDVEFPVNEEWLDRVSL